MGAKRQYAAISVTVLLLMISLIRPPYPFDQSLQHGPTVLGLILIVVGVRRSWLSERSLFCMLGFCLMHILGARYTYSNVPYDEWTANLFGSSLSSWFGWQRNHYDRLVHFAFGFLAILPLFEWGVRGNLSRGWAIGFALLGVLAISAFYEILEWLLTIVAAPEAADSYNGQQGDLWDAQKDMALAFLGSLIAMPLRFRWSVLRRMFANVSGRNL